MGGAMHGDHVMVRLNSHTSTDRPDGQIIRVLEHKTVTLVGTFEPFGGAGWVIPLEQKYFHDIFIPAASQNGAKRGQIVVTEITAYPTNRQPPAAKVIEILGYSDDPEVEIRAVFRKHGARQEFPPKVLDQAMQVPGGIDETERKRRQDLTKWMIFTIDGETAKDFDDAVSIERFGNDGYRLGVHIADVSHFVEKNSPLDQEAFHRGTSIYFPNGVIPMLPFQLSNDICSLKPDVERLTLSILIDFDIEGNVLGHDIFNSIIKSKKRFTYNQVAHLLEKGTEDETCAPFLDALKTMYELSQTLRKRRFQTGSVDFKIPEPEIHMNAEGKVDRIVIAEHNVAHELIEEFMLAANQAVARHLWDKKIPSIHRIHEEPNEEKLTAFKEFILSFGLSLETSGKIRSLDLHQLLQKAQGRPEERVINTLLLRTMKRARYSEKDPGHFCLGFKHYTHFTSPIRRYPDLVTHRLVKSFLKRKASEREKQKTRSEMTECADQSSLMEDKAMQVEREINDLRRTQFMSEKVGHAFTGIITSVTSFGFFVELMEVFVEGLVRVSSLTDDYYVYIEAEHKLIGQRRHRRFKIGDQVRVRVAGVNIPNRQIDLTLLKNM